MEFNIINFETCVGAKNDLLMQYENYIIIKTLEELVFYSMYRKNLAYANIIEMRKLYDKYINMDLDNFLAHFGKDGYAGMAFRKSAIECLDLAEAVDIIMAEINQSHFRFLQEGNVILINSLGGWFFKPENEIKIHKRITLIDDQIKDWFDTKERLLECILCGFDSAPILRASTSFVQTKEGRIYYHNLIYNHDAICRYHGLNCDSVIKYDYNPKNAYRVCELGIAGLSYSIVYETVDLPFEPKDNHAKEIEKFIEKEKLNEITNDKRIK